jgi:hypothetical protein
VKASSLASRSDYLVCPICQAGELHSFGGEWARCSSCECIVGAATLLTLEQIILSRLSLVLRNDQYEPGGLARVPDVYGAFPFRATSSPEVGRSSTCSSVMSTVR